MSPSSIHPIDPSSCGPLSRSARKRARFAEAVDLLVAALGAYSVSATGRHGVPASLVRLLRDAAGQGTLVGVQALRVNSRGTVKSAEGFRPASGGRHGQPHVERYTSAGLDLPADGRHFVEYQVLLNTPTGETELSSRLASVRRPTSFDQAIVTMDVMDENRCVAGAPVVGEVVADGMLRPWVLLTSTTSRRRVARRAVLPADGASGRRRGVGPAGAPDAPCQGVPTRAVPA